MFTFVRLFVSEHDVRARLQRPRSREVTVCQADGPARSYPRSLRGEYAFRLVVSRLGYVSRTWEASVCSLGNPIRCLPRRPRGHPGIEGIEGIGGVEGSPWDHWVRRFAKQSCPICHVGVWWTAYCFWAGVTFDAGMQVTEA